MTNATPEHIERIGQRVDAVKERLDLIDKRDDERINALSAQLSEVNKNGSERADALSAQLAAANNAMSGRVDVIENRWFKTKLYGAGFLAAFTLCTGYGVKELIKESKSQAVAEVTPLAKKAAVDEVILIIPKTVTDELDRQKNKAKEMVDEAEQSKTRILAIQNEVQEQLASGVAEELRKEIAFLKDSVQLRAGIAFKVDQTVVLDENAVAGTYIVTYTLARNGNSNCADLVIISPKDTTHHPNNPPFVAFARYNEKSNGYQIKSVDYSVVQMPGGKFQLVATVHSFDKDAEKSDGTARYVRLR